MHHPFLRLSLVPALFSIVLFACGDDTSSTGDPDGGTPTMDGAMGGEDGGPADQGPMSMDQGMMEDGAVDLCPDDPAKEAPGVCGCGTADTDGDGDGSADCVDECPADPAKTVGGTCGCGTPDDDTDGDGTLDCFDGCPSDAAKTAPGTCGCGVSDGDSDGDGTIDCEDGCPADGAKTAPGTCGCGVADADSDGDGALDCDDACPADGTKTTAGMCGCGTPDTDSDSDGVADCTDGCPSDGTKITPGTCGCGTPDTDTDGDGAIDCTEECPGDPTKTTAGTCGCGTPDVDSDGNGTVDCLELCPSDPTKTTAGVCGCGVPDVDSDGDGTLDCNDGCPSDGAKALPGVCGCGVPDADGDGDGVLDCNDQCASDPAKSVPGICGCLVSDVDSDSDGTADCNDLCPSDGTKTAPGTCGCGTPDTDSDSDGTADCNDLCPSDGTKTAPGTCGCGTPDTDSDSDGTADCNDLCPADGTKTVPGTCGCGTPDTDSDGDGTLDCVDQCPSDGTKTLPGTCGCGIADVDSDGDGFLDCVDNCPADPNPGQADSDGNGVGDVCECDDPDGDGYGPGCAAGTTDCAPADPSHWSDCGGGCTDLDRDDRGPGCDLGADCDDTDHAVWSSCGTCAARTTDTDHDGHRGGCDLDDCDETDFARNSSMVEIPGNGVDDDCGGDGDLALSNAIGVFAADPGTCIGGGVATPSDTNPGTMLAPVETLARAMAIAAVENKPYVFLNDGVFQAPTGSGTTRRVLDRNVAGGFFCNGWVGGAVSEVYAATPLDLVASYEPKAFSDLRITAAEGAVFQGDVRFSGGGIDSSSRQTHARRIGRRSTLTLDGATFVGAPVKTSAATFAAVNATGVDVLARGSSFRTNGTGVTYALAVTTAETLHVESSMFLGEYGLFATAVADGSIADSTASTAQTGVELAGGFVGVIERSTLSGTARGMSVTDDAEVVLIDCDVLGMTGVYTASSGVVMVGGGTVTAGTTDPSSTVFRYGVDHQGMGPVTVEGVAIEVQGDTRDAVGIRASGDVFVITSSVDVLQGNNVVGIRATGALQVVDTTVTTGAASGTNYGVEHVGGDDLLMTRATVTAGSSGSWSQAVRKTGSTTTVFLTDVTATAGVAPASSGLYAAATFAEYRITGGSYIGGSATSTSWGAELAAGVDSAAFYLQDAFLRGTFMTGTPVTGGLQAPGATVEALNCSFDGAAGDWSIALQVDRTSNVRLVHNVFRGGSRGETNGIYAVGRATFGSLQALELYNNIVIAGIGTTRRAFVYSTETNDPSLVVYNNDFHPPSAGAPTTSCAANPVTTTVAGAPCYNGVVALNGLSTQCAGNISADPQIDAAERLASAASPCVDAGRSAAGVLSMGNWTLDVDGDPRPNGTAPDIGIDELY